MDSTPLLLYAKTVFMLIMTSSALKGTLSHYIQLYQAEYQGEHEWNKKNKPPLNQNRRQ
jgi:hypothetical protein